MSRTPRRLCAVAFDLDGTLVDSEQHGHRPAFNQAFDELGLPYTWDEPTYRGLLSIPGGRRRLASFLQRAGHEPSEADQLAERLHKIKTTRFRERCERGDVPARPGARRLLDELAEAKVPTAVVTTGGRAWVEPLLDHQFGLVRFSTIVTGDDVAELKPAPDAYVEVLARLGCAAEGVVAVEDAATGLASARAAGVPCLVVANDDTRDSDFEGAALVVDGFGNGATPNVLHGPADVVSEVGIGLTTLEWVLGTG